MTRSSKTFVTILSMSALAASAWALCPDAKDKSATNVVTASVDGRSETTKAPCGGAPGATPCSKSAQTKSAQTPCGSKTTTLTSAKAGCPIESKVNAVLTSLPSPKFKVGDEVTECRKSAGAMAKAKSTSIEYVLGDETFATEGEVEVRLASMIEDRIETMKSVQYASGKKCFGCPTQAKSEAAKSGTTLTYRVGGVDFADKTLAEKAAALAGERLNEVKLGYRVGKQSFCCDRMAGAKAEETGEKTIYVVGEDETDCPVKAQQLMAKAKLAAVISAAMAVLAS